MVNLSLKKIIVTVLMLVMMLAVLSGCGKSDGTSKPNDAAADSTSDENNEVKAERTAEGEYIYELTEEQEKNFSEAKCYLFQRIGREIYLPLLTDTSVTKE